MDPFIVWGIAFIAISFIGLILAIRFEQNQGTFLTLLLISLILVVLKSDPDIFSPCLDVNCQLAFSSYYVPPGDYVPFPQ